MSDKTDKIKENIKKAGTFVAGANLNTVGRGIKAVGNGIVDFNLRKIGNAISTDKEKNRKAKLTKLEKQNQKIRKELEELRSNNQPEERNA